jgi:protein TonB
MHPAPAFPNRSPRLGFWRDDDRAWRRLAWVNAICALTLLAAAVPAARLPAPEPTVATAPPLTPVEVELTAPIPAAPAPSVPVAQSVAAPAPAPEPPRPTVVTAERPALTARVPLREVRPAASLWTAPAPAPPAASSSEAPAAVAAPAAAVAPAASPFVPQPGSRQTPQPPYPDLARQRGQTGTVRIEFAVTPGGQVTDAVVALSSGFPLLDAAALNTVRDRWQFPAGPARRHYVDIVFQLRRAGMP